ncbi:diguanylate cyclase (GGDEF)-like protein [Rhodobium orientis]|uniref:diguanylate cyclase n=1 Tax=Rhodobium orientis TaxID=34017 RepID=A0A327JMT8_9HYPH|nr:GGDEF domain-containing protein [Rhodobium orientis]MBB4304873.1 diguanylate cyclase (GGDEF)-like protein [Rhodobium orientis]MBK5949202.1 hypothetical protein [Rhodobium orientis]RAI27371.1 hypothetical protein CH339_10560 [Rhodobium orientis]
MDYDSSREMRLFTLRVTVLSVVVSVLLTVGILTMIEVGLREFSLAVALGVPALVAPVVAYQVARSYHELAQAQRQLRRAAESDALTGLWNRSAFARSASALLGSDPQARRPRCLLFIDADHFKRLNDSLGHLAGDEALVVLADVLRTQCRTSDLVARMGGEEFAVLLRDADEEVGRATAERIRKAVFARTVTSRNLTVNLSVSIGVAAQQPGDDLESLLSAADHALYEAKGAGRNCVLTRSDVRRTRRPVTGIGAAVPSLPLDAAGMFPYH